MKNVYLQHSPVEPLGHVNGRYHFLAADGELIDVSGKDLEQGRRVFELFMTAEGVKGGRVETWLGECFPATREKNDFDATAAGRWLISESKRIGLYDTKRELRSTGVWRADDGGVVAHCGDALLTPAGAIRAGVLQGGAVYPRAPRGPFPSLAELQAEPFGLAEAEQLRLDLLELLSDITKGWNWRRPEDAIVLIGWIGCALLGAFPRWRPHLYVNGPMKSGKTTLAEITQALLGPLVREPQTDASAAGLRRDGNAQALPLLFDEAEGDGRDDHLNNIIKMFRGMSGSGERTLRATADDSARNFVLRGAGALFSIIPAPLAPQDVSRFLMIDLGRRPKADDPKFAAQRLASMQKRAREIGAQLWRLALYRARVWDAHFEAYSALVQSMGGDGRDGDTIGAMLAGYDLLTGCTDAPDDAALEEAERIAAPLVAAAREASQEDGEGESCLRRLLNGRVNFGSGKTYQVARLVSGVRDQASQGEASFESLLSEIGLRYARKTDNGEPGLYVYPKAHPQLDQIFSERGRPSRWQGGGHVAALRLLDGVRKCGKPVWISGGSVRPLVIPDDRLPSYAREFREEEA